MKVPSWMRGCSLGSLFSNFVSDFFYFNTLFWETGKGKREELHWEYIRNYSRGVDLQLWTGTAPLTRDLALAVHIYISTDTAKLPVDALAGFVCHGEPIMQILRRTPGLGKAMVDGCRCLPYHLAQCGKCRWFSISGNMVNKTDKIIWIWRTTLYTVWTLMLF